MINRMEPYEHSYIAEDQLLSSLAVHNVGKQKCKPGYQWSGIRDHYLIHHVLGGKGHFEARGQSYDLKKGDTFLIYPNMKVCYRADEEDPWTYTWVGFDGTDAFHLLNHTDFSVESPVLEQAALSGEIERMIMKVYEAKGNTFCDAVSMTGALYSMIAMLMEHAPARSGQQDLQAGRVERAVRYIAEHYAYPITVEEIADYTGVCRSYLYRMFREVLKQSPKDCIEEYRIRQASLLLSESDVSVATVAHSVGYEDPLYFSKAFKKCKGQTPSEYRKRKCAEREDGNV